MTGTVEARGLSVHGTCYCRDCQAFARYLGRPERMLDAHGGTEVIGTLPGRLRIDTGMDQLACITLTPRGPLRWYAQCCRMAIGNGSRTPRQSFVTLHCRAIDAPPDEVSRVFGPVSFRFAVDAATSPVPSMRAGFPLAILKILWNIVSSKVSGAWRVNPFFRPGTDEPVRAPQALTHEQRYALRGDSPPA